MNKFHVCISALALMLPSMVRAGDHVIEMKTNGPTGIMVFEPAFVQAKIGDTIHFVPTQPSHNAATIAGMLPAGAAPITGKPNLPFVYKIEKAGLYGIECNPHFGMGMVALIKAGAGASPNAAAARAVKLPPLAAKRMAPLLAAAR